MLLFVVFVWFCCIYFFLINSSMLSLLNHSLSFLIVLSLYSLLNNIMSLIFSQSSMVDLFFVFDEFAFWLILVCGLIIYFSFGVAYLETNSSSNVFVLIALSLLFLFSCVVFYVSNFLVLYVFYEMSLLPILYIILNLGVYPDRFLASVMMLLYTTFVSFPLMVLVLYFTELSIMLMIDGLVFSIPLFYSFLVLFSFAVKLPLFGIHYWLPMAHVEAPTYGSMILAGILLKLGGAGLFRFSSVVMFTFMDTYLLSYLIFALVISSLITSLQVDFKRLVAYSSVVHMTMLVLLFISGTAVSYKAFLLVIVLHGLVSPFMFMMVGVIYKIFSSRLFPLIHGVLLVSYSVAFLLVIMFLLNVPTPPFSSFVSEVLAFLGIVNFSYFVYVMVALYVFFSLVFNLVWLSGSVFGKTSLITVSGCLTFYETMLGYYFTLFLLVSVLFIQFFNYAYNIY